eukprot:1595206-Pyramimonas_sp.AAC.1
MTTAGFQCGWTGVSGLGRFGEGARMSFMLVGCPRASRGGYPRRLCVLLAESLMFLKVGGG